LTIFEFCATNDTEIHAVWIPREQNTQADYLSRIIDIDDWEISTEICQFIDELWGPHSWNPGSLGVNSFISNWSQDVNWLVPPVPLDSRAINHLVKCKANGTLIVPK
jgi:hypothetical protein